MKNIFALAALGSLLLSGCDAQNANAQVSQTVSVGNPDSANLMVIEEDYEVLAPVDNAPQENWSKEGNVEVAPLPEQSVAEADNGVNVKENLTETVAPNVVSVDVGETVEE